MNENTHACVHTSNKDNIIHVTSIYTPEKSSIHANNITIPATHNWGRFSISADFHPKHIVGKIQEHFAVAKNIDLHILLPKQVHSARYFCKKSFTLSRKQ